MFLSKDVEQLYDKFAETVYQPNVLDVKTKELIAMACSVMADCVPCIEYHHKKAIEAGATKGDISETLAITMSISAGSKKAKYGSLIK